MNLPAHPQQHDDQPSPPGVNRVAVAITTIAIALAAVLVIAHLTGVVGPG
jgi:hypothetical protein